jgi:hypothetical protein
MKQFASSWVAVFVGAVAMVGCGAPSEESGVAADETGTASQALSGCQINPNDMTVRCDQTGIVPMLGRQVYYRIGAETGPGYNAATGRHAVAVLFQGTGRPDAIIDPNEDSGGSTGPAFSFSRSFTKPDVFGAWYQVATVVALVDAGYTVIQPPAGLRPVLNAYAWATNLPFVNFDGSEDQALVRALIAQMQPAATTFGPIDINHVYAVGISSGGFMSSRMANQFASGLNPDGTVKDPVNKPFRAVAINSAAYMTCAQSCNPPFSYPATHAPTMLLHSRADRTVFYNGANNYFVRLSNAFPSNNAQYTVNGVRERMTSFAEFTLNDALNADGESANGHQWSSQLTGDTSGTTINKILDWFNTHR